MTESVIIRDFGSLTNNQKILHFTLDNGHNCQVGICEYGAIITSIKFPDRDGKLDEVCLGFNNLPDYVNSTGSFGTTVGRYANRITKGQFTLNDKLYQLEINDGNNQLHGGPNGFGFQPFKAKEIEYDDGVAIKLERVSPDGEGGYPGNLNVSVTYKLSYSNVLTIEYDAICDQDTYVNLTNHAYFNLDGIASDGSASILDHEIQIHSNFFTPLDAETLCTGEIKPVDATPFDLRELTSIRKGTENPDDEMRAVNNGYDISFVIGANDGKMKPHALVKSLKTGRALKVVSTQPCNQFYSGPHLTPTNLQDNKIVSKYAGFCLEAQDYPNGPVIPHFPTSPLLAGEKYHQIIEYHFISET
ncbi:MAG: galactose mutarotase [Hyphomicrobiales bacterium]